MVTKPRLRESDQADTPHNYIIIAKLSDLSDLGETNLTRCLNTLGRFGEAMPGVYVLQSTTKLSTIQKTLQTATTESDKVLVVDATANRLGWFNLGSEADIHLRSVWDKKLD